MRTMSVSLVLITFATVAHLSASPDTLRFHPPDSLVFSSVTTSTKQMSLNGKFTQDSSFTTAKNTLKKTGYGYRLSYQPTEVRVTRDGQVISNPVVALMTRIAYTYILDSAGNATTVTGFENIHHLIDSALDSTQATTLKRMVTPEAMSAQTIAEWNGRIEMLTNRPLALKKVTYDKSEYMLPTQQKIPMYGGTMITDTPKVGGIPCVRVRIVYASSPDTLAKLLDLVRSEVVTHYMLTDSVLKSIPQQPALIVSDIVLIAERKSLLIREEQSRRDASITVTGQGPTPQTMTSHETRNMKMTY